MRRETASWLLAHWREIVEWLPAPGHEWQIKDIDDCPYRDGQILTNKGVVDHVKRSEYGQAAVYETNDEAYDRVQDYREQAIENGDWQ